MENRVLNVHLSCEILNKLYMFLFIDYETISETVAVLTDEKVLGNRVTMQVSE